MMAIPLGVPQSFGTFRRRFGVHLAAMLRIALFPSPGACFAGPGHRELR